jgi:hypothetical protein
MILQTSSGSIRKVSSLSNVTRPGAAPIFASKVRPITVPDGTAMVMYGTYGPFVLVGAGEQLVQHGEANLKTHQSRLSDRLAEPASSPPPSALPRVLAGRPRPPP